MAQRTGQTTSTSPQIDARLRRWTLASAIAPDIGAIIPCAPGWRVLWAAEDGVEELPVACWALIRPPPGNRERQFVSPVILGARCMEPGDDNELFITILGPGQSSEPYVEEGRAIYADFIAYMSREEMGEPSSETCPPSTPLPAGDVAESVPSGRARRGRPRGSKNRGT